MARQEPLDGMPQPQPEADDVAAWEATATKAIKAMAATGQAFTISDAAARYDVPNPPHPNHWGALAVRLHHERLITPCGYTRSTRPTVAGSAVRQWTGTTTAEAAA